QWLHRSTRLGILTMAGVSPRKRHGRRDVSWRGGGPPLAATTLALARGCETPPPPTTSPGYPPPEGPPRYPPPPPPPAPPPGPPPGATDDCVQGGRLFKLYCGSCHNARPLGERPFSNYHVAVAHMRNQAYLTGKEYRQIILFLRRWQDVGPPTPDVGPTPKRLVFPQPISELRGKAPTRHSTPPSSKPSPWQPPGTSTGSPPP